MRATRKDARWLRIDKRGRKKKGKEEEKERAKEEWRKTSRSPVQCLKKKKNGLSGDNFPWRRTSEDEERVVLDRGISGWSERRENTSNLLLYNAGLSVSIQRFQGAQHVGNPHTLHRITLSRKFVRNIMPQLGSDIAVRIYHSGKNEGFPLLSLSLLLSCSLALSSSVHYARRPFVTHKLE